MSDGGDIGDSLSLVAAFKFFAFFFLFLYNHSNYSMWYLTKDKGAYELPFNDITRGKGGQMV